MRLAETLGLRIKERREQARLTQGQLAMYAGVSRSYVSRLEQGEYEHPDFFAISRIAKALNTTIADLSAENIEGDTILTPLPRDQAPFLVRLGRYTTDILGTLEYVAGRWTGTVEQVPSDGAEHKGAGGEHQGDASVTSVDMPKR